eukprot:4489178-Pyramimonas_sp.AAC.1
MAAIVIRYALARDRGREGSARPGRGPLGVMPGTAGAATAADIPVNPARNRSTKKDEDPDGGPGHQKG